ncbi:hypothetical protein [Dysosmobacter sp.]|uniref:hypothetical protein n=1 Tax=Dysosmobacter sp. TaxID=2591382 RepID=UPI003AF1023D
MHNHKQAHGTVHPAPAGENIRRAPAPAHGKCKRRRDGENGQNKVPLRHLEDELERLEHNDNAADHHQQPRGGQTAKRSLVRKGDFDRIRNLHDLNDAGCQVEADLTNLWACQEQERENEGAGKEQLRVFCLEAQAGQHGFGGLEYQISDQQRPADRQHTLHDWINDRHMRAEIGEIHAHNVQQCGRKILPAFQCQAIKPLNETLKNQLKQSGHPPWLELPSVKVSV